MSLDKKKSFILNVIFIALILGLGYIVIKYVLPLLMPFIIGLIIAMIFRRIIDYIDKKTRIKRSFVSIFILIIFYGILVFILSAIGSRVFTFIKDVFGQLPDLYRYTIEPALEKVLDNLMEQFPDLKPYIEDFIANLSDTIFTYIKNASSTVISTITGLAGRLPSLLIKLIFTIVSSFFFTIDYYKISGNNINSNNIVLAEGVFDIFSESIFDSLGIKNNTRLYASALSTSYESLIKSIVFHEQEFKLNVSILSDSNMSLDYYRKIKRFNKHIIDSLSVYYNKSGKDFNVTPINPEKFIL